MAAADPREALRRAIALEHVLYLEVERHQQLAARWQDRAELALHRGHEELARGALERKTAEDRRAAEYRSQYLAQTLAIRRTKRGLQATPPPEPPLEDRLDQLALADRLDRDLAALKAQLQTPRA